MAINFTDNPSNGATQVISGRTYTYNSTKNKWDTTATEVTGPTATVYASVDNLPTSGNITGSQAFVSGTNRLYIWNGSGWYNIALINNTPTISGANSSYALAIDGTATTVTLVATDPEGLPITYSIASDTSGNTATVTQGTGSNTNVFTITPSTNTAHAGTFSLTFRASDGVNLGTAVSSFTLQFNVQNQRYTTALITSVGANNAVNNSFDDKSTLDHTITANGDIHQTTFSPYRHGGYSVYFDGSGDNLGFASLSALNVNTYMSLECWVKLDDKNNANELIVGRDAGYWLMYDWPALGVAQDKFGLGMYAGSSWQGVSSTTSPESGVWYHIVGVREDSTLKIYVNGTLENTATISGSPANGGVVGIGANTNQLGGSIKGYLADVRVVISANSSSLPYTANFTPSTDRLTAITDTQLLACHLPYMQEGSTHGHTITMNGNVAVVPLGPHDKQEYAAADHSGSMHLDGTGDYLTIADHADLDFGSSDWTIEGWYYPHVTPASSTAALFSKRGNAYATDGVLLYFAGSNTNPSLLVDNGSNWTPQVASSIGFTVKAWNHFAATKSGNDYKFFINGKQGISTTAATTTPDNSAAFAIGCMSADGNLPIPKSNIADFRVVKGTAVYTSEFTPPTAPLTAITNTKLLIQGTDAGIIDKSQSQNTTRLYGNAKSSTTQSKYLTSSISLAAAGDYIQFPSNETFGLGTADFTLEAWVHWTGGAFSGGNAAGIIAMRDVALDQGVILMINRSSGNIRVYDGPLNTSYEGTAISQNTWHHVAVTRQGTTWRIFKDGTQENTWTSSSDLGSTRQMFIGRLVNGTDYNFIGYISDARVTKGLARYTANFTPPTAALSG